jgi:hypothetical protein
VKRLEEERARSLKPDETSGNDRLSGGRSCRESNSTDLKPPERPAGAKEEVVKQEASGESAAASKESSDVRSSCRRGRPGKTASGAEEEEEAASSPRAPPALSPSALLDAVAGKLAPVMERLREHEVEVPVITAPLCFFFHPRDVEMSGTGSHCLINGPLDTGITVLLWIGLGAQVACVMTCD